MRGLPLSNEKASLLLQGEDLHPHLNEALLLHGTKRDNLAGILAEGFRLDPVTVGGSSGTAFGDGIYLCDKPGKADQYTRPDAAYDDALPLHRQLYGGPEEHPGDVFYVLVCRVTLGYPALTRESKEVAKTEEPTISKKPSGEAIFRNSTYNQLPTVKTQRSKSELRRQDSKLPIRYHSLFALRGKALRRYREVENLTGHYIFFLGAYRFFYILNWVWRSYNEEYATRRASP